VTEKPCAFCSTTANITGEHLFSDWINRILGPRNRKQNKIFLVTEFGLDGKPLRAYPAAKLNLKVPVVCDKCNNGWMSDIEDKRAKPAMADLILSNEAKLLTPEQVESISVFAFKCVAVGDYSLETGVRTETIISQSIRDEFKKSRSLPHGFQLWLAAFKNEGHGIFQGIYHVPVAESDRRFEFYALTFGSGFFLCQAIFGRSLSSFPRPFPGVTQGSAWDKFSIPVWPPSGTHVLWPPKKSLSVRNGREVFPHRWNRIYVK
jgi:hypothetical protein